ncbi:MAG: P-loop NTPase fold protein [Bacteroidia bacterium]
MAKIFISYSYKDKNFVLQYIKLLKSSGHEILMDENLVETGQNMQKALMKGIEDADGIVVFITPNSIKSQHVNSEIGFARSYFDNNKKFLIPLVIGGVEVPYIIGDLMYLEIDKLKIEEVVKKIIEGINRSGIGNSNDDGNDEKNTDSFNILKQNSQGERVKEIQTILKDLGFFASKIDGIYGRSTHASVVSFQAAFKLPPTGEVDETTYNFIKTNKLPKIYPKKKDVDSNSLNQQNEPPSQNQEETKSNENVKRNFNYEFLVNQDIRNGILKTNYLIVRIGFEQFMSLFPPSSKENNLYDYREAEWDRFLKTYLDRITTPEIRILPLIYWPVDNIPLLIKPENIEANELPEEGLKLLCDDIFKFQVTVEKLINEIPSLSEQNLFQKDKDYEGITCISKEEYDKIIQLSIKGFIGERFNPSSLSEIFTDSPSALIKDELDFESDINALASIIAYKEVKPPLAVGLFGNWGSGKSFFMNKLQKRIGDLAEMEKEKTEIAVKENKKYEPTFCKEVVQINFNSWHYSDSNLWASLITKIFEDLDVYGKRNDPQKLETLFNNLNSSKELIDDTNQKLQKVVEEIKDLKSKQEQVNIEIKKHASHLKELSFFDIAKAIFQSKTVKDDVDNLQHEFDFLRINELSQIKSNIDELDSNAGKLIQSFKLIYSFRNGNLWKALLVGFIFFAGSSWLVYHVDFFKEVFGRLKLLIVPFTIFLSQAVIYFKPAFSRINLAYTKLKELKEKTDELEEKELNKVNSKRDEIQSKIEGAQNFQNELKQKLEALEVKRNEVEFELKNIISGRKIVQFIESRITDSRYINSLGIISWIRKDFEQFDFLLKQQYEAKKLDETKQLAVENVFEIDRIILYIDDLDRCDVSIVVKVLEAIHLLLAFPLFVVVVGVDPRWMHNALTLKYKDLLFNENNNNGHDPNTVALLNGKPATSYDYLEKIFQVPFVLKPIDDDGKDKLIKAQFVKEIKIEADSGKSTEDKNLANDVTQTSIEEKNKQSVQAAEQIGKPALKTENSQTSVADLQYEAETRKEETQNVKTEIEKKDEKGNEQEVIVNTERLKVTGDEINFMQGISFIIGETPRTVKRYINIYRIIRTHTRFEFSDNNELEHYYAAMILLAVITGLTDSAKEFFDKLNSEQDSTTFGIFLQTLSISNAANKITFDKLVAEMKTDSLKTLGEIKLEKFKKNLNLIKRFSFRNLE